MFYRDDVPMAAWRAAFARGLDDSDVAGELGCSRHTAARMRKALGLGSAASIRAELEAAGLDAQADPEEPAGGWLPGAWSGNGETAGAGVGPSEVSIRAAQAAREAA